MPSLKKCADKYKKGYKQYKDCIAYRNVKVSKKSKSTKGGMY